MTTPGTVIATIAAGVATDPAGNANAASTSTDNTVTWDNVAPTVTINQAVGQADPTNASPINFTVVFSEAVTGFATGDVTFTAAPPAGPRPARSRRSGTTYNVAVTGMTGAGTVIASIAAGVAHRHRRQRQRRVDLDRQHGHLDNVAPTVTINQAVGQPDPTNTSPINFTVVFSEAGHRLRDRRRHDRRHGRRAEDRHGQRRSGTTYNVAVTGMTTSGTVIATIARRRRHRRWRATPTPPRPRPTTR